MNVSDFGLELIKAFEGFFAKPYRCPAGVLTQGYGHTAAAGPPALGGAWSKDYATRVLARTVADRYAAPVYALLNRKPTQAQFDAMVSLAYNIGVGAFSRSSVLRWFNLGHDKRAADAFGMWTKGGGKVLPGLVRRRASEALVYQGVKDLDFDGKRDSDEPVYGPMAQAVEPDDTSPAPSPPAPPPSPPAPAAEPAQPIPVLPEPPPAAKPAPGWLATLASAFRVWLENRR
jgi:lysozyme